MIIFRTSKGLTIQPTNKYEKGRIAEAMYEHNRMINEFYLSPDEAKVKQQIINLLKSSKVINEDIFKEYSGIYKPISNMLGDIFIEETDSTINRFLNIYMAIYDEAFYPFVKGDKRVKKWVNELEVIGEEY